MRFHAATVRKAVLILIALAILIFLWRVAGLRDLFLAFIAVLERFARKSGPLGALAFLALSTLAASIGPFTVVPLVPAAVGIWGIPATAGLMMLGGLLGATLTYLIGRYAGGRLLAFFVRPKRLENWKTEVPEHAAFFLALVIKFALPAEIGYVFGMLRFGLAKYLLVTFISYVPIIAAILWGSEAFLEGRSTPVIVAIAALVLLTLAAGAYLKHVQDRAHAKGG